MPSAFMKTYFAVTLASLTAASALATASAPVTLILDTTDTSLWRTAIGTETEVCWDGLDPAATSATLSVVGRRFSLLLPNQTEPFATFSLPAPSLALEEDVFRIAVTFDTGNAFTQKVGRVLGSANSPHVDDVAFRKASSARWPRLTGSTAVLPIPAGAQSISVNGGTPVDTGLGGARGWYLFGPVATGEYDVALATDAGGLEGTIISCALGTVLMLQ